MKTFFSIFFGILAAALVTWLVATAYFRYQLRSEARSKADQLKLEAEMLAAGCSVLDADNLMETQETLASDLRS